MLGAASHFGILRDTPTIGVAKSHLCGTLHSNPKSFDTIILNNEVVGARYLSKPGCKPIYISTGHRISLTKAVELTKTCITTYRLPEPIRLAHNIATESRQKLKQT
jgi:deoxyribonuclease V